MPDSTNWLAKFTTPPYQKSSAHFRRQWPFHKFYVVPTVTIARWSLVWAPTLPTTQSNVRLYPLFKVGVWSKFFVPFPVHRILIQWIRCITRCGPGRLPPTAGQMVPHTLHHTILALEAYELGELWQQYGLVGDVVVCPTFFRYFWILN